MCCHYSHFQNVRFFIPFVLFSVLSHFNMLAQTGTITGKVSDAGRAVLSPGADLRAGRDPVVAP